MIFTHPGTILREPGILELCSYSLGLKIGIGIRTIPLFIRTGGGPEPNIEFSLNLLL